MEKYFDDPITSGFLLIRAEQPFLKSTIGLTSRNATNTILCNLKSDQNIIIDQVPYVFPANSILPLVSNQQFVVEDANSIISWQFNREFYCILEHDKEVGCAGFLFSGFLHPLFIPLPSPGLRDLRICHFLAIKEMENRDVMQGEMLRTLLKGVIINITRYAKKLYQINGRFSESQYDLVRQFNLLVEENFRNSHEVRFYADLLNRSPKTLSNVFSQSGFPSPSKLIQDRIILEAKRYLLYTNKSVKEIGFALGFATPSHFSRFFKSQVGQSIALYRDQQKLTSVDFEMATEVL